MSTEDSLRAIINFPLALKQVEIGSYKINYAMAGSGPALLLIHGANFGWGVWYPNIPELAKQFTIYAIDLPGAGRSSRLDYSKMEPEKDLLEVVDEFTQKMGLENFSVIGCSMGGWIALRLALKHPEKVKRIVVENTVGFADYMTASEKIIGFYPFAKFIAKIFINPKNRKNVKKFLMEIFYNKNLALPEAFIDYFCETMQTSHNLLFISRLTALHKKLNLEKSLSGIHNKTLIVWGEKDVIIPLHKNAQNFKLIPQVQISVIKDAGHIPSLEKPQEFNSLVNDFLTG